MTSDEINDGDRRSPGNGRERAEAEDPESDNACPHPQRDEVEGRIALVLGEMRDHPPEVVAHEDQRGGLVAPDALHLERPEPERSTHHREAKDEPHVVVAQTPLREAASPGNAALAP